MFWKGFRPQALARTVAVTAGIIATSACTHYPFKYEPYSHPQAFNSQSEMEATVKHLESYAQNCRPDNNVVTSGSCTMQSLYQQDVQ